MGIFMPISAGTTMLAVALAEIPFNSVKESFPSDHVAVRRETLPVVSVNVDNVALLPNKFAISSWMVSAGRIDISGVKNKIILVTEPALGGLKRTATVLVKDPTAGDVCTSKSTSVPDTALTAVLSVAELPATPRTGSAMVRFGNDTDTGVPLVTVLLN